MAKIPTYIVPPEIWKAEEDKLPLTMDFSMEMTRKRQKDYLKSSKTMIHLEETAQTLFLKSFDQSEVRIFYSGVGRTFFFLNEVSNSSA